MLREDLPDARAQLEALARPRNRYRATWAAYMLGNLETSPAARHAAYARVRSLAERGAVDTLGLALASLRQDATAGDTSPARRLAACVLYRQHGGRAGCTQLQGQAASVLDGAPEDLDVVVADPVANVALGAHLLLTLSPVHQSSGSHWPRLESSAPNTSMASARPASSGQLVRWQNWRQAMERVEGASTATAPAMAWALYEAGLYDEAQQTLSHADAADPLAAWVEAHLLLRQGQRPAAITRLQQATAASDDPAYGITLGHQLVYADRYEEALAAFLDAGAWWDAAWVAENVMTVPELEAVIASWPPGFGATPVPTTIEEDPPGGGVHILLADRRATMLPVYDGPLQWPLDVLQAELLRSLLARRLGRAGRWADAVQVAPHPERGRIQALLGLIEQAEAAEGPERGRLLWEQAQILRADGPELLATEFAPDFAVYQFRTYGGLLEARTKQDISPAERDRITGARKPEKRFHYRYVAADLAWEASLLLPDHTDETLQVLCRAGRWLENKDPKAADRFYKAMVNRGHETALGRYADELRWFPPTHDSGGECYVPTPAPAPEPPAPRSLACAAQTAPLGLWGLAVMLAAWRRRQPGETTQDP